MPRALHAPGMQDDSLGFFRRLSETTTGRNMYHDTKLSVRSPLRTVQVCPVESGWLYQAVVCVSVRQLSLGRFHGECDWTRYVTELAWMPPVIYHTEWASSKKTDELIRTAVRRCGPTRVNTKYKYIHTREKRHQKPVTQLSGKWEEMSMQ